MIIATSLIYEQIIPASQAPPSFLDLVWFLLSMAICLLIASLMAWWKRA